MGDHHDEPAGATRELADLRRQVLRLQRHATLDGLTSGIVHDFNNLLTSIVGTSAHLEQALGDQAFCLDDAEDVLESLGDIAEASRHGAELAMQLLDLVREGTGHRRAVDLNTLVGRVGRLVTRGFGRAVTLETRLTAGAPRIRANASEIQHALLNLCLNACEAMDPGGVLTLTTAVDGARDTIELWVTDTGCGMSEVTLGRIFDPYFTTKAGSARGGGTGLGLLMVRAIVEQHAGEIAVTSRAGVGTTFTLRFPRRSEECAPR